MEFGCVRPVDVIWSARCWNVFANIVKIVCFWKCIVFIAITVSQASFIELLFNKPALTGQCLGLNIVMRVWVNNFSLLCFFGRC